MKVKSIWDCECGESRVLAPVDKPHQVVAKGEVYLEQDWLTSHSYIFCRMCADKYQILAPVISANKVSRVWKCGCKSSTLYETKSGNLLLGGKAFTQGSPTTHVVCRKCKGQTRVAPDVIWWSHLKVKLAKRQAKKKSRRSKRRG